MVGGGDRHKWLMYKLGQGEESELEKPEWLLTPTVTFKSREVVRDMVRGPIGIATSKDNKGLLPIGSLET